MGMHYLDGYVEPGSYEDQQRVCLMCDDDDDEITYSAPSRRQLEIDRQNYINSMNAIKRDSLKKDAIQKGWKTLRIYWIIWLAVYLIANNVITDGAPLAWISLIICVVLSAVKHKKVKKELQEISNRDFE